MNWLTNLLSSRKRIPRLIIDAEGLFNELRRQLPGDYDIRIGDRNYVALTDNEAFACVRNVVATYVPQLNDCDDLSNLAKGEAIRKQRRGAYDGGVAAFGQVWLPTHAVNFYLNQEGKVRLIDNDGSAMSLEQEVTLVLA